MSDGWSLGWPNTEGWVGDPSGSRLVVFDATYALLLLVNSVVGFAWVLHRWRRG